MDRVSNDTASFRLEVKRRSDRLMNYFLPGLFLLGVGLAPFYGTWGVAFGIGGLSLLAYYGTRLIVPESDLYQYILSAVLGIFMAQYIFQMHGLFEMHFFAFIGSAILITYQNWKLQIPILLVVLVHHAAFSWLQNAGFTKIYFTQLEYFELRTFIIHIGLSAIIFFTCGLWSYQLSKYSAIQIRQAMEMGRIEQEALRAEEVRKQDALRIEEARQREAHEQAEALERAVAQGKFEMAADVLHDIGNAMVGFGSYLNRVRRFQENSQTDNLQKLSELFRTEQASLGAALGEAKAGAITTLLEGVSQRQKSNEADLGRSVVEQSEIIARIEQILHIQRHYIDGRETQERRPVDLCALVGDCLAMQQGAVTKRGITVHRRLGTQLPAIKGDQTKLMQVILHMLKNSIEALERTSGDRSLWVTLEQKRGMVTLELKDDARGADATSDMAGDRGSPDTGLGWENCRAIVESHAGVLNISSGEDHCGPVITLAFAV